MTKECHGAPGLLLLSDGAKPEYLGIILFYIEKYLRKCS